MENYQIAEYFSLLAKLMEVHGENSFKVKSYSVAAYNIDKLTEPLKQLPTGKIFSIQGIGDTMGKKILELLQTGKMQLLDDLIKKNSHSVLEMLQIKRV